MLITKLAGARPRATPDGRYLATGYRWRFPIAGAFTIGDVVVTSQPRAGAAPIDPLTPAVWAHECRHSQQYAWCGGLPFIPLYGLAAAWSYAVTGDIWTRNVFETRADLAAGGYEPGSLRPTVQRALAARNRLSRRRQRG